MDLRKRGNYSFDSWTAASLGNLSWLSENFTSVNSPVNQKNRRGWTPLMYASYYGHGNVVHYLLKINASVTCLSKSRKTALMMAAMGGSDICTSTLLQHDANVNDQDSGGWTALMHAASYGYHNVVQVLIAHGADVNRQCGPENITALMLAAESGHLDVVQGLLEAGANARLLSTSKQSAYSLARDSGHGNVVALLEGQNSRIDCGPRKVQELINCASPKTPSSPLEQAPDLTAILGSNGLSEYAPLFVQNNINVEQFLKLTADDLKAFGVIKVGPRSKMANLINKINIQHASSKCNNVMDCHLAKGNQNEMQMSNTISNSAIWSGNVSPHGFGNFSTLQQKMEHLLCLTDSLKNRCRKDFLDSEFALLVRETDDLTKDIYTDFKTIFGNQNV